MRIEIKNNKVLVNITAEEINKSYGIIDAKDTEFSTDIDTECDSINIEVLETLFSLALSLKDLNPTTKDYSLLAILPIFEKKVLDIFCSLIRNNRKSTLPTLKSCECLSPLFSNDKTLSTLLTTGDLRNNLVTIFDKGSIDYGQMEPLYTYMTINNIDLIEFMEGLCDYVQCVLIRNNFLRNRQKYEPRANFR